MPAATAFLTRKRPTWQVLLDMPVGLTPPQLADGKIITDPSL
jgi:hypothetical protein